MAHPKFLAWLLASTVFTATQALGQPVTRQVGNLRVTVSQPPGKNGTGALTVTVADIPPRGVLFPNLGAVFQGQCREVSNVRINVYDSPRINLDAYMSSRSGRDLPIKEHLQVMQQALSEQCANLQVIRVTLESVAVEKYGYRGTLTKSNGWTLQDGFVATEYDASAWVDLNTEDTYGRVRVLHKATCESDPILLMEPANPRTANPGDPNLISSYLFLAESASYGYAKACPSVKRVRFALGLMPADLLCKAPGDCFMESHLVDQAWKASHEQFKYREHPNPIETFADVAEVLAAGAFDVLKDYPVYFNYFVWAWFQAYSDVCREHIRTPVGRVTKFISVTRDRYGTVISERVSSTVPIVVESSLAWAYDAKEHGQRAYLMSGMMRQLGRPPSARAIIGVVTDAYDQEADMKAILNGKCTDRRVLAIQDNMLNVASGKPLTVGEYTTSKKPIPAVKIPANSAPEFIPRYLRNRQAVLNTEYFGKPDASAGSSTTGVAPAAAAPSAETSGVARPTSGSPTLPAERSTEVRRQHAEAIAKLTMDHQAQRQNADVLQRMKIDAEFKYKRIVLDREYQERLRQAQQP